MIIEIITTGDEVLTGFTVDTNASWLSLQLLEQGWQVRRRQTVGDRMDDLTNLLQERSLVADVIIFNGGLGPTSDDKTTDAVAQVGPEGDFSKEEVQKALSAGFAPVSLGNSRLRTETAGVVACCTVAIQNS